MFTGGAGIERGEFFAGETQRDDLRGLGASARSTASRSLLAGGRLGHGRPAKVRHRALASGLRIAPMYSRLRGFAFGRTPNNQVSRSRSERRARVIPRQPRLQGHPS